MATLKAKQQEEEWEKGRISVTDEAMRPSRETEGTQCFCPEAQKRTYMPSWEFAQLKGDAPEREQAAT